MIKLEHIRKDYVIGDDTAHILKDISLEIKEKEYVGILGSSGSGKSTLMHLIGLLDSPTSGHLIIDGKDAAGLTDTELSRMRNTYVGFVFQQFNLINKLTVLENVLLPCQYSRQILDFDPHQKATELLTRFGIIDRQNFYPNKISGGQQQRVAIARALIMNPKLILADEPTGNLDTKTGNEIMKLLEELNQDLGVTIILVTHEKDIAARTRRQIFIRDGEIVAKYL